MRWLIFLSPAFLWAAYVGNPGNPAIMNTGFFSARYLLKGTSGYIYDYISNKRYRASQKNPEFDPNKTFKEFGIHSQLGSFSVILLERMEIFGAVGGSKEQAKGKADSAASFDFESSYQFSWSAGSKVVLIQWGSTCLGCDFTYFAIPASSKSFFKYFDQFNIPIDFGKQPISLKEWQISGGLSSRFAFLTPYVGCTYLHSRLHVAASEETGPIDYRNEVRWGYFYGLTLSMSGRFHLNFERRVRNEFGYTFATIAVF